MHYTRLFFLLTSLLAVLGLGASESLSYPKDRSVIVLYRGRNYVVSYSNQEPVRELIGDFKKKAGIPNEKNIKILLEGKRLDENELSGSYSNATILQAFAQ